MPICKLDFKPIKKLSFNSFFFDNASICEKCFLNLHIKYRQWKIGNVKCLSLFDYDDNLKNLLYQFKGAGDIELDGVFLSYFSFFLRLRFLGYLLVPVPSSSSHDEERGFNQVERIFSFLHLKMAKVLVKTNQVRQSLLPKEEREKIFDYIRLLDKERIKGKKTLLVDDIYTTGSTAKACIRRLQEGHPKSVFFLSVAKVKEKT